MEFKEPGPLGCAKPVLEYSYTEVPVLSGLHTNFWYVLRPLVLRMCSTSQIFSIATVNISKWFQLKYFHFHWKYKEGGLGIFSQKLQKFRKIGKGPPCEYFQQILFSHFLKIVLWYIFKGYHLWKCSQKTPKSCHFVPIFVLKYFCGFNNIIFKIRIF